MRQKNHHIVSVSRKFCYFIVFAPDLEQIKLNELPGSNWNLTWRILVTMWTMEVPQRMLSDFGQVSTDDI